MRIVSGAWGRILQRRERGAGVEQEVGRALPRRRRERRDAETVLTAELAVGSDIRDVTVCSGGAGLDLERELADLVVADGTLQQEGVARGMRMFSESSWVKGSG